jgi:hypothetical protein
MPGTVSLSRAVRGGSRSGDRCFANPCPTRSADGLADVAFPLCNVTASMTPSRGKLLFVVGATARWANDGITANALNPGAIATNWQRHVGGKLVTPSGRQKTPEQGAATSVLLATSPDLEGIGGRYFNDSNEPTPSITATPTGSASPPTPSTLRTRTDSGMSRNRSWRAVTGTLARHTARDWKNMS